MELQFVKDDALSPVVAFMLLLMVVVSFISLLNAYYIPSLKQQAEIEHLQHARDGITAVDNDIWRLISDHPGAVVSGICTFGRRRNDLFSINICRNPTAGSG